MRVLRVEGAGKNVAVAEKRIEAWLAGLDNHRITLPRPGVPLLDFDYAAFGVNAVGLQIHNHDDTIQNNPDIVRRFVMATMRAFETAMANPAASIRAEQKATSDLETDLSLEQLKVGIALMPSKASHGRSNRPTRPVWRSPSSSEAVTSGAVLPPPDAGWTAPPPTTSACSPRS